MVTVQMSQRRWNRILSLEQTYKLARAIKRSMDRVETAPAMSAEDAVAALRSLWKYESLMISKSQLIYIYEKADYDNVSDVFLRDILKRME